MYRASTCFKYLSSFQDNDKGNYLYNGKVTALLLNAQFLSKHGRHTRFQIYPDGPTVIAEQR